MRKHIQKYILTVNFLALKTYACTKPWASEPALVVLGMNGVAQITTSSVSAQNINESFKSHIGILKFSYGTMAI